MRHWFLLLLLLLSTQSALAVEPESPREVSVGLYLVDILAIDETGNAFTAEIDIFVSWQDTGLAFDTSEGEPTSHIYQGGKAKEFLGGVWRAQIYPTKPVSPYSLAGEKLIIHADGRAELTARLNTAVRARLDYRHFPFDTQVLPIELESYPWNKDQVRLVANESRTGYDSLESLAEWEITGLAIDHYDVMRVRDVVPFANLSFNITVKRDPGFYLWKIFLTVIIIVSLTWVVFWMSGEGLGRRAGVSSSGILTVIAYQFVTTSSLPKVSYLTVADKVMILSVVAIAATMVESILVDSWTHTDQDRKLKIDKICRVAFPATYLSALVILAFQNGLIG